MPGLPIEKALFGDFDDFVELLIQGLMSSRKRLFSTVIFLSISVNCCEVAGFGWTVLESSTPFSYGVSSTFNVNFASASSENPSRMAPSSSVLWPTAIKPLIVWLPSFGAHSSS